MYLAAHQMLGTSWCTLLPLQQQRCTRLAAYWTRQSTGRQAGHGLAGRAAIAVEFLVADAATVTSLEPKLCKAQYGLCFINNVCM